VTPNDTAEREGRAGLLVRLRELGPGALVAAAFLGPGTVTTATLAGSRHGVTLLWALLFSVAATLVLQEMAARLGLVTGRGLGEAVRARFDSAAARWTAAALVIGAVVVGNAAYQTGNLLGGALGLQALAGGPVEGWSAGLAAVAAGLLWTGSYRVVERVLLGLVALMSLVFLATAAVLAPALPELLRGLAVPELPAGGGLVALGLVGTTVVPYNLFLHASAVGEKWSGPDDLGSARVDSAVSIAVGGAASMAVVVTAAAAGAGEVGDAADMAVQLEPLLGTWARGFFAAGLLAAGVTSAVTAPLAAAYAAAGVLGWERDLRAPRFRAVWGTVLGIGAGFAAAGASPVPVILFAQAANGVLLPAVAVFLLVVVNDRSSLGRWRNGPALNVAGLAVAAVAVALGVRAIVEAL
jgi:manganese transport protein